ncbi:hypothetical protein [Streptomyces sp. NPDC049813]|uniref:hypothetical protein n=1 Tax=Streptomyces sp. NPDC049813 TaxID=3365597 RepID=UPI0037A4E6C7
MGEATKNNVSTAHLGERFVRHPLTGRNLKELGVAERAAAILERDKKKLERPAEKKDPDGAERYVSPVGFSLNRGRFEGFPEEQATAHERGWYAYMTVGVPLIEERGDIAQPPPDVISKQTYVNRTDPVAKHWSHSVEFSITNTISWSLQGQVQLTFGAKVTAALQQQLQQSMAANQSEKTTVKNSKDNIGMDKESQSQSTNTATATGTATGTGELSAQLMLGITGSVSGSLSTAFKTTSTVSGDVASRVDVLATQRRQVRRFDYEFPVSFGGWVALYYPEPVKVKEVRPQGPQDRHPEFARVIAWKLGETGSDKATFDLNDEEKPFFQKGQAEVVSTLAGVHEVFELENIDFVEKLHPLHKVSGKEKESERERPVELASGLGSGDGLAVDPQQQKAYVTDRGGGRLRTVGLADGRTESVLEGLGDINDVALDLPRGKAYYADYSGRRLCTVDLSGSGAARPVVVAEGMYAYGVALDLPGSRVYVSDLSAGKLIEYDVSGERAVKERTWDVPRAAGVALSGGRAYVGQYDRGELYEVELAADEAAARAPKRLATRLGYSVRVAAGGAAHAYVADSADGWLYEVDIADGEGKGRRRVVADGLGTVCGVVPDHDQGCVYVSNRQGKLLRVSGVLPGESARV